MKNWLAQKNSTQWIIFLGYFVLAGLFNWFKTENLLFALVVTPTLAIVTLYAVYVIDTKV